MHNITSITQNLLNKYIIELLDNATLKEIRELVKALYRSAKDY